ncbi:MAG: nucleotidyltransferase family protein [Carboxydocellales bacterium]
MKGMIMAAGVGTRLYPLTKDIPKPMVPIAGRPLMEHIVHLLRKHGITQLVANLHYLPDEIQNYFKDGSEFGVNLKYTLEPELLGTAGGVKNNRDFLDETFVIVSGDALTDINLGAFMRFHKTKGAIATIALKPMEEVERFGVVITNPEGRIINFQEKPQKEEALSNLVNTGIYIFEPEIFNYIPNGEFYDFGKDLFPKLALEGASFCGYITEDYWCDVGNLEAYSQAQNDSELGKVKLYLDQAFPRKAINFSKY